MDPSQEFKDGENFMLFKLKKYVEGAKDSITLATRVLIFINKEEENGKRKG